MKKISLIIPAYNEEKRIKSTLHSLNKAFGNEIDLIVVSNGSSDGTVRILNKWKEDSSNLEVLDFPEMLGKGGAILEGFKVAKKDYIGFIDADDSFDLEYIKLLIKELDYSDCVIASKWKGRKLFQVNEPFLRKILSRGWNTLVKISFSLNFDDTQAGAKFLKKEAFNKIKKNFICKDFSFDVELLYRLKKEGFKIKEYYVPSKHQEGSTFSSKHIFSMFKNFVKLLVRK